MSSFGLLARLNNIEDTTDELLAIIQSLDVNKQNNLTSAVPATGDTTSQALLSGTTVRRVGPKDNTVLVSTVGDVVKIGVDKTKIQEKIIVAGDNSNGLPLLSDGVLVGLTNGFVITGNINDDNHILTLGVDTSTVQEKFNVALPLAFSTNSNGSVLTSDTYSKNEIYTKSQTENYVNGKINDLIDSAPDTLNTLNELAVALNNNSDVAAALTVQISAKAPLLNPIFTNNVNINNDLNVTGALTVGTKNIIDELSYKQKTLINGTVPSNTARVLVPDNSGKIRSIHGDNTITVTEVDGAYMTIGVDQTALTTKQNTLSFTTGSNVSTLGSGSTIKGIKAGTNITLTDINNILTLGLNDSILSNYVSKQTIGNITYFYSDTNTSNGFRMAFNKYTESVDFQYFDNDSITPTDGWQSLGTFTYNTTSNVPTFSCNNITATSSLKIGRAHV